VAWDHSLQFSHFVQRPPAAGHFSPREVDNLSGDFVACSAGISKEPSKALKISPGLYISLLINAGFFSVGLANTVSGYYLCSHILL
jgi:hypothetical protein